MIGQGISMEQQVALGDPGRCTIVITVHGRQRFLPRITDYYADFGAKIVIADSSLAPAPANYIRSPRAKYVHLPGALYYEKMQHIFSSLDTPYVVECPDDDFVLKNAILEAIAILDADDSSACVVGRTLFMSGRQVRLSDDDNWILHAGNMAFNRPGICVLRRLAATMRYFMAYNHCVYRRQILLRAYGTVLANKHLWPIRFIDKILGYVTVCLGRVRFLERPMCQRDETRLLDKPQTFPKPLEVDIPFSALPQRLRSSGDPLAPILAEALGVSNITALERINQKLFSRIFGGSYRSAPSKWLAARYSREFAPAYQDEIREVLMVVRRHRTLDDKLVAAYFWLRRKLAPLRRGVKLLLVGRPEVG
jgi:glycosyltransferase domain-containing protein